MGSPDGPTDGPQTHLLRGGPRPCRALRGATYAIGVPTDEKVRTRSCGTVYAVYFVVGPRGHGGVLATERPWSRNVLSPVGPDIDSILLILGTAVVLHGRKQTRRSWYSSPPSLHLPISEQDPRPPPLALPSPGARRPWSPDPRSPPRIRHARQTTAVSGSWPARVCSIYVNRPSHTRIPSNVIDSSARRVGSRPRLGDIRGISVLCSSRI